MNKVLDEKISTVFENSLEFGSMAYDHVIEGRILRFLERNTASFSLENLPLIDWQRSHQDPYKLSIEILSENNPKSSLFFYEMLSRWLIPHKELSIVHFLTTKVCLSKMSSCFLYSEFIIEFADQEERDCALKNFPIIAEEIATGACSLTYARKILELKGGSADAKLILLQNQVGLIHRRFSSLYQEDIFVLLQRCFLAFTDTFKSTSEVKGILKLVLACYLMGRDLEQERDLAISCYHVKVRPIKIRKQTPLGMKKGIGLLVGLHFIEGGEIFELPHLEKVLLQYFKTFIPFEENCLSFIENGIHFRYIEWLEENQQAYTQIKHLKKIIEEDFKLAIEKRVKQVFSPRNEEEIFKNGLTLAQQLNDPSDLPQVMISFENQQEGILIFNALIARVLTPESSSLERIFQSSNPAIDFFIERVKQMGTLKEEFVKELSILQIEIDSEGFLREDHSVDILKARQAIVKEMEDFFKGIRDFNGGLIARNDRALEEFIEKVNPLTQREMWLAKTFFHSIYPIELKSIIPLELLSSFYKMLSGFMQEQESWVCSLEHGYEAVIKRFHQKEDLDPLFDELMLYTRNEKLGYILYLTFGEYVYIGAFASSENSTFTQHIASLMKSGRN